MPRTPDRFPGEREEDVIVLNESTVEPDAEGKFAYKDGQFRFRDSTGIYDPRTGGSGIGNLIFKEDGGLVYSTAGDVLIKVTS